MDESQRIREAIEKGCGRISSKVEQLLKHRDQAPPSNSDDVDLMDRVLSTFKMGRMNNILQQFNVQRLAGVEIAGTAALIAKRVPRDQLIQLFESRKAQEGPQR